MQGFRDLLKGWFGKVLLTIFILPFALFGIQGLFQASGRDDAAITVDGIEITGAQIERSIEQQRQSLAQRMGKGADPSLLTSALLRPGVEKSLIQKSLLQNAIVNEGLYIPQEAVSAYVRAMPMFIDEETNQFSQKKLERLLVQAGYSGKFFFQEISESMLIDQLRKGLGASAFVTSDELKSLVVLGEQKRDVATLTLSAKTYEDKIELTEEEIQASYKAKSSQYQSEEKVKVSYLNITTANFLSDDATPSEEAIRERFDAEVQALTKKERRRASHILVEITDEQSEEQALAKIKQAKTQLDAGEEFDAVAQEFSEDIATARTGGDLGFAGRDIYDPAFEESLFSMEKGQVSDIVRSEFGYHLIRLVAVESPDIPQYAAESKRIAEEISLDKASEELSLAVDELNRLAFESGDLLEISKQFDVEVKTSDWIKKTGGIGLFTDRALAGAAFSESVLKDKNNSEVIETDSNGLIVLRLAEHESARTLTFDEVKDRVVTSLKREKAVEKAKLDAEAIVSAIEDGGSSNDIETQYSVKWKVSDAVGRQGRELDRAVVTKLFELPKPSADKKEVVSVQLGNGDWVVMLLSAVTEGEYKQSDAEAKQLGNAVSDRYGQSDFESYLATLKEQANIVRN
ncbi:MAG: hypothetical protein COA99_10630 [Moraxellaceae bacterium]|nr:MAG: hypothetical protein COA99_10630 [Moraxellaceae bacterium]